MSFRKTLLNTLICTASLLSTSALADTYLIHHSDKAPNSAFTKNSPAWDNAETLTQFSQPWTPKLAPATEFKALWNNDGIYFRFRVADDNVVISQDPKRETLDSDRVEFFLASNPVLSTYYSMKIDPISRIHAQKAQLNLETAKIKLDNDWYWNGLSVNTSRTDVGYNIEGHIPMELIGELNLWQDKHQSELICGMGRANMTRDNNDKVTVDWLTWIDPNSEWPSFHTPNVFGKCKLVK